MHPMTVVIIVVLIVGLFYSYQSSKCAYKEFRDYRAGLHSIMKQSPEGYEILKQYELKLREEHEARF